jgi:chitin synthase
MRLTLVSRLIPLSTFRSYLTALGLYDEDVMQITSYGFAPSCHLFERSVTMDAPTSATAVDGGGSQELHQLPPLQSVFALKDAHGGKLDSHFWFFSAFCPQLNPSYVLMLDAGTKMVASATSRLIGSMDSNANVRNVRC